VKHARNFIQRRAENNQNAAVRNVEKAKLNHYLKKMKTLFLYLGKSEIRQYSAVWMPCR